MTHEVPNRQTPKKIVPGVKPYSKAHVRNTLIITDSTISRIPAWQLKQNINLDEENVITKRHPGSTAKEISHFCTDTLDNVHPEQFIVIAIANDIRRSPRDNNINEHSIVENILNIARYARKVGTQRIFVSSVLIQWGEQYQRLIKKVNNLLEYMCRLEGFIYLDHGDISSNHICQDGLHPNGYGKAILKMNILKCFTSFNPYFNDFYSSYEKAIL